MKFETVVVPLIVGDYDSAIEFYCRVLGLFEVGKDTGVADRRSVVLDHVQLPFSLGLWLARTTNLRELMGRQSGDAREAFVILPVSDCEALFASVVKHGVPYEDEGIVDLIWGRQLCVRDPFGTMICLMEWNPYAIQRIS